MAPSRPQQKIAAAPTERRASQASLGIYELLGLLLAMALVALGLWQSARVAPRYPIDLTVKEPGTRLEWAGFYIPESNDEFRYRWSQPYAFLQLRNASPYAPGYLAQVRLRVPAPDPSRQLTFTLNERPIATATPSPAFRVYRLAIPAGEPGLRLGLAIPEMRLPGDVRPLGVVLTGAEIAPLREPSRGIIAGALLGLLALWALQRAAGASPLGAILAAGAVGCTIAGLVALAQPSPLGHGWLAALALLGAGGAALLTKQAAQQAGLGALAAMVAFSGALRPSWLTDDAFISFRYAQNLAQGHGLVYNIGERVEGYTNFLWTILAALVLRLGGEIVWWSYASGVALALAIVLLTYALAQRMAGPGWALAAALIAATSQSLLIHTARGAGLETGLFTLLILTGVHVGGRGRSGRGRSETGPYTGAYTGPSIPIATGLIFALATLTRPEGLLFFGLLVIYQAAPLLRARQIGPALARALPMLLSYAAVMAPFFIWRYSYYGDLLPNTFYAKTGGGLTAALRGLSYAWGFALALGGPLLLVILLLPLRARIIGENRAQPSAEGAGYLAICCTAYALYVISVGGDHFPGERFFVVLVPLLAALIASGLGVAYRWLRSTPLRPAAPALLALLMIGYGAYAMTRAPEQDVIAAGSDESLGIWREIGWWLAENSPPDATIAAMSAGAVAFYSERTTIDMLGLTDRHIARVTATEMGSGPAGHEKRDPDYVLNQRQPTYIPQMWEEYFGGADALRGQYELITITTRYGRTLGMWRRL